MILERTTWAVEKSVSQVNRCYLVDNSWDDFGFQTLFEAVLFDDHGVVTTSDMCEYCGRE